MSEAFGDISAALFKEAKEKNLSTEEIFSEKKSNVIKILGEKAEVKEINGYINIYFKEEYYEKILQDIINNVKIAKKSAQNENFLLYYINNRCEYLLKCECLPGKEKKNGKDCFLRKNAIIYYYKYFCEIDILTGEKRKTENVVKEKAKRKLAEIFYQRDRETTWEIVDYIATEAFYKLLNAEG